MSQWLERNAGSPNLTGRWWTLIVAGICSLALVALGVAGIVPTVKADAATWNCTAAAFQACSVSNDSGWDEYNNPWNNPAMPPNSYTLDANSHSSWQAVANQATCPTSDCAVEAYESAQFNYANTPGSEEIANISTMTSSFDETMPTGSLGTNGFDAEAAYDIWLNNYGLEVMVWVDNQGQTPAGSVIGTATLGGQNFTIYQSGSTYSFVLDTNETQGTVDILAVLHWLTTNGYTSTTSYMTQFNFGFEICSTGGVTDTFTVNALSLTQSFT